MKGFFIILSLLSSTVSGQSVEYRYDSLDRINEVVYENTSIIKYSYDENGNKISKIITLLKCNLHDRFFVADTSNNNIISFKWEVNEGNGFNDVVNNSFYDGANTSILHLINIPTNWYGYLYRCLITFVDNSFSYNPWLTLTFVLNWKGSLNDAWENPLNWSCGVLPDENTDVIIDSQASRNPVVYTNGICRSLNVIGGSSVLLKAGADLKVMGR